MQLHQNVLAVHDKSGRVLVDVYAADGTALATVRQRSEAEGMRVLDQSAEHKILEGYVAVSDVKALPATPGVASVSQALKPFTRVGAITSQGVEAERLDRVPPGIDGRGITVGALSDSFATATETIDGDPLKVHAPDDVKSGDVPAEGVTVLQDDPSAGSTDEGRAMLQIVHDVAPRAEECFATAEGGEMNFTNNIRALADKNRRCGADVVVDDVGYFAEPFYGDGVISDAVDDVAAKGVHYFSSAGNGSGQQAYQAPLRLVGTDRQGDRSTSSSTGSTRTSTRAASRTSTPGWATSRWTRRWASTARPPARASSTSRGMTERPQRRGRRAAAEGPRRRGDHGRRSGRVDPIRRHRGRDDPRPRRRHPVGLDGLHPHAEGPGRQRPAAGTGTSPETVFQTLPVTGRYTFEVSGTSCSRSRTSTSSPTGRSRSPASAVAARCRW